MFRPRKDDLWILLVLLVMVGYVLVLYGPQLTIR